MKKQRFVFLLAVFVIILTGCSASVKTIHNFELRNGVRFGDDVATIKQKEVLEPAGNENDLVYKGEIKVLPLSRTNLIWQGRVADEM